MLERIPLAIGVLIIGSLIRTRAGRNGVVHVCAWMRPSTSVCASPMWVIFVNQLAHYYGVFVGYFAYETLRLMIDCR